MSFKETRAPFDLPITPSLTTITPTLKDSCNLWNSTLVWFEDKLSSTTVDFFRSVHSSGWKLVFKSNQCTVPEITTILQDSTNSMRNLHLITPTHERLIYPGRATLVWVTRNWQYKPAVACDVSDYNTNNNATPETILNILQPVFDRFRTTSALC